LPPKEKLKIVIGAAHFDFAQYRPPPFRIFTGLRLAEVASATQTGGIPRPALFAKRAGRNAFGLIQEYSTKLIAYTSRE